MTEASSYRISVTHGGEALAQKPVQLGEALTWTACGVPQDSRPEEVVVRCHVVVVGEARHSSGAAAAAAAIHDAGFPSHYTPV